ncbi:MAG: hypothetical protein ACHP65_03360 [Legionellales bacterium]
MLPMHLFKDLSCNTMIPSVQWPPIMDLDSTRLLLMLDYFEEVSQWLPEAHLLEHQFTQLHSLVVHAKANTQFYRGHLHALPQYSSPQELRAHWGALPVVTTEQLIANNRHFFSENPLVAHGPSSSVLCHVGSESIQLLKNNAVDLIDNVLIVRDCLWNHRIFKETAARLFASDKTSHTSQGDWGHPFSNLLETGSMHFMHASSPAEQAAFLAKNQPGYLFCTAKSWNNLFDYYCNNAIGNWSVKEIIIEDEPLTPMVRQWTEEIMNTAISDRYARADCGIIALRCPEFGNLHVQAENVFVEILDDYGNSCAQGLPGRVTITKLHNFSSPLIRYQVNDRAALGEACPCKRTLPVLILV